MIEPIERMRKLVNDNLVMGLRFQMNRELNELEREIEQELNSRAERTCKNVDDHKTVWFICSVCGYQQKLSHTRSYCPNCGARVVE